MNRPRHLPPPTKFAPLAAAAKYAPKPAAPRAPARPGAPPPPFAKARPRHLPPAVPALRVTAQPKPAAPPISAPRFGPVAPPPAARPRHAPPAVVWRQTAQPRMPPQAPRPPAAPLAARTAVAPPAGAGVVQPWRNYIPDWLRHSIAAGAGAVAGTAAFVYTPDWSLQNRAAAALATSTTAFGLTEWALRRPNYARSFSAQINNQATFYQDIERRLNTGASFDEDENQLTVSGASLWDAANRLRARERQQRELAGTAYAYGREIFDATIPNHVQKNALWRTWMARASGGRTHAGGRVGRDFRDRVATTLARVIATAPGYTLLHQVDAQARELTIPIDFEEEEAGAKFNLSVTPNFDDDETALTGLTVTVPAAGEYDDAQSFKRSNWGGEIGYNVRHTGRRLTAAPLDTDLFHEFVHAAHYLAMERRRQNAVGNFVNELAAYRGLVSGFNPVLRQQDKVSEATTIHRSASLKDLRRIALEEAGDYTGTGVNPHHQLAQYLKTIRKIAETAQIPSENTYREAIGLAPRQDHRGLTLTNEGYTLHSLTAPIEVV